MHALRVLVVLAAAGLASPAAAQRLAESPIHWPPPPDTARVLYVGSLASEADIGRRESFWSKLKRALIRGRSEPYLHIERPFDVYVDSGDRFYVTNGLLRAVVRFDRTTHRAAMLGEDVPGGLGKPMGLGGDPSGHVYVADPGLRRVVVFDRAGAFVRMFGDSRDLLNPVDVAVDADIGRFYVVDSYAHQVVVYDRDGRVVDRLGRTVMTVASRYHGERAARSSQEGATPAPHGNGVEADPSDLWDNRGSGPGEFRYPVSADVGPDGTLYVSDQMNFRVQAFDRSGQFVRTFGGLGDRPGNLTRPKGVAVDSEGHIYVVDAAFNNVQIFNPQGDVLLAFGQLGRGDGEHWLPLGLAVDRTADRIYVADRFNNRTQIYQYLGADPAREAGSKAESRSP